MMRDGSQRRWPDVISGKSDWDLGDDAHRP